jgi:hypothetical protein
VLAGDVRSFATSGTAVRSRQGIRELESLRSALTKIIAQLQDDRLTRP